MKITHCSWLPLILLFTGIQTTSSAQKPRLNEFLSLPPVMDRLVGNPPVEIHETPGTKSALVSLRRPAIKFAQSAKVDLIQIDVPKTGTTFTPALAQALLEHFWEIRLKNRDEDHDEVALPPMSKDRFVAIGRGQLTGKPIKDPVGNAWWKVRMDEPLTPDPDHHLIVMAAKSPAEFYSHFALGLRKTGSNGAPNGDWVLDPRAPWLKDTHPSIIDWFNFDKSMIMTVEVSHLTDWMYTQTAYRGYGITMQFTPATEEYVTLLLAAGNSEELRSLRLGPFEPFRNNCATHGQELIEALLPLDERLCGRHPIADLPKRVIKKTNRRLGLVTTVEVPPQPAPPGVDQSQNSTLREAPDPADTPEVHQLRSIPIINGK